MFVTELWTLIKHITCVNKIARRLKQWKTRQFSILKLLQLLIENTTVLVSCCVCLQKKQDDPLDKYAHGQIKNKDVSNSPV